MKNDNILSQLAETATSKYVDQHDRHHARIVLSVIAQLARLEIDAMRKAFIIAQKRTLEGRAFALSSEWLKLNGHDRATKTVEAYMHGRCLGLVLSTGRVEGTGLSATFAEQMLYSDGNILFRLVRVDDQMIIAIYGQ